MFHGSMVALATPMDENGTVLFHELTTLLDAHLEAGTSALIINGTTGESPTLTADEKIQLLKHTLCHVKERIPVIAGTGATSTAATIAQTQAAMDCGVDACLIVTPSGNKPTQEGLFQHYKAVAEACAVPLILYNVPGRTACDLLPETVLHLAEISNIIGIKEATGDMNRATKIIDTCGNKIDVYSGDDPTALELMLLGGKGVISVTANVAPRAMHNLCKKALLGEKENAQILNASLLELHHALFLESNPIPAKWALHRMGLISAGIRLPLTPSVSRAP